MKANPYFFKNILCIYFLEREGGRERNTSVWLPLARPLLGTGPTTQACALTGTGTGDLSFHRLVLNPLSHTSQGGNRISLNSNPTHEFEAMATIQ